MIANAKNYLDDLDKVEFKKAHNYNFRMIIITLAIVFYPAVLLDLLKTMFWFITVEGDGFSTFIITPSIFGAAITSVLSVLAVNKGRVLIQNRRSIAKTIEAQYGFEFFDLFINLYKRSILYVSLIIFIRIILMFIGVYALTTSRGEGFADYLLIHVATVNIFYLIVMAASFSIKSVKSGMFRKMLEYTVIVLAVIFYFVFTNISTVFNVDSETVTSVFTGTSVISLILLIVSTLGVLGYAKLLSKGDAKYDRY